MPIAYVLLEDVAYEFSDKLIAVFQSYPTVHQLSEQLKKIGCCSGFIANNVDHLHSAGQLDYRDVSIHIDEVELHV